LTGRIHPKPLRTCVREKATTAARCHSLAYEQETLH
jgi:hypothetical protein